MKSLALALALFTTAAVPAHATPGFPWKLEAPAAAAKAGPRVLLMYDMEGISGISGPNQFLVGEPDYPAGRKLLAGDVNAVAAGLFNGGASEVWLVDAHGSGNPEADMPNELMDKRLKWVERDHAFDPYVDISTRGTYDAVAVVGMHSKNGAGGFAAHTYTIGVEIDLDGRNITETELVALSFGQVGTPVILATGDDKLQGNLSDMPWLKYVKVKDAIDPSTVTLRPLDQVHAEMTAKAAEAVRDIKTSKAMVMTPTKVTVKAVPPADLSVLEGFPGIDYHDNGVTYPAKDFHSAYRAAMPIIGVMRASLSAIVMRTVMQEAPNGAELRTKGTRALVKSWFDAEGGKVEPVEKPAARIERGDH
jgi:D-amino peptidase